MSDSAWDRTLILLALLAPLAMFALSKWRASLETWYVPLDADTAAHFGPAFEDKVAQWLAEDGASGARLVVIVDPACPCTTATLSRLADARAQSTRPDASLEVRHANGNDISQAWATVLAEIPATPTLLAVEDGRLLYAGPVTAGNFCTTAVSRVLGLSVLETPAASPLRNWLDRGCYCPLFGAVP